jgi:hypothetical protein
MLASLRGNQAEAATLIEATLAEAAAAGQGIAVAYANWVAAILANSLGGTPTRWRRPGRPHRTPPRSTSPCGRCPS